ncbi:hypothetical protein ACFQDF_21370 [Ectobacillus funiculus]
MKFKWPKWAEEQKRHELSVQRLIPIRGIDGGVVITEDFRLVQLLRVSSLNLDLMSHRELNEAMERYELFTQFVLSGTNNHYVPACRFRRIYKRA